MKYSSHLYLRTDGTLGKYSIIELDNENTIIGISECGNTLREEASTRFYAGVIVAGTIDTCKAFEGKEAFIELMKGHEVALGEKEGLSLIENFDLNTFSAPHPRVRQLTKKLHIS